MKRIRRGMAMAALLAAAGWAVPAAAQTPAASQVYVQHCAICHARDGSGQTMMGRRLKVKDLRSGAAKQLSAAQVAKAITDGVPPDMGGYAHTLSAEQIQAVAAYVHAMKP